MLRITVRFPLGVYHGQAAQSADEPEWPPSPLRLIGALLAGAHERPGADPDSDRALLDRLCNAPSPAIVAPETVALDEPIDVSVARAGEAVRLRGATRWAPRNYVDRALSPRNLGRERAAVSKVGVAIGDRPVHFAWPDVDLTAAELARLRMLAGEVAFLGTTRSPVIVHVADTPPAERYGTWQQLRDGDAFSGGVDVRVPDVATLRAFDMRHEARRSSNGKLQGGGMVPQIAIGRRVPYRHACRQGEDTVDPGWWGDAIVLAIARHSELRPKAPAAYLLARAVRVALLGAYGEPGSADEAPPILTGRGSEPHCAIVPLPHIWGDHADGAVLGIAVVLPHERRVPDLPAQRLRLEHGLRRLVEGDGRFVQIPGAGRLWVEQPDPLAVRRVTLRFPRYAVESRTWASVTPVVHSRWRKGGPEGLLRQLEADCAHVGLPAPSSVEILRGPGRHGGAARLLAAERMPASWGASLSGQTDHVRITFPVSVRGPVLLGRARHFGGGLCVPVADATAAAA